MKHIKAFNESLIPLGTAGHKRYADDEMSWVDRHRIDLENIFNLAIDEGIKVEVFLFYDGLQLEFKRVDTDIKIFRKTINNIVDRLNTLDVFDTIRVPESSPLISQPNHHHMRINIFRGKHDYQKTI